MLYIPSHRERVFVMPISNLDNGGSTNSDDDDDQSLPTHIFMSYPSSFPYIQTRSSHPGPATPAHLSGVDVPAGSKDDLSRS